MVSQGVIYRGLKPVYWSPATHTALAEAELEYFDHKSESVYVRFDLESSSNAAVQALLREGPVSAIAYTTTPWTLPSNICLCVNPDADYSILSLHDGQRVIVMHDRIADLASTLHSDFTILLEHIKGVSLQGSVYSHPLFHSHHVIIAGHHVTNDTGTGIVHTAPAHGLDDFAICCFHGVIEAPGLPHGPADTHTSLIEAANRPSDIPRVSLPPSVPRYSLFEDVDEEGKFGTAWGDRLTAKSVLTEGNSEIAMLEENKHLILHKTITHRYPFDWRAKQPVISRVTPQWFISTKKINPDEQVEKALQDVTMVPQSSMARLTSMIHNRPDWCISRQRSWGVPIPVVFRKQGDKEEAIMSEENIDYIISLLEEKGTDYWFGEAPDKEFVLPSLQKQDGPDVTYSRCRDTLDVWIDSGVSWFHNYPNSIVDLYLEGSDQHRGWFQSSIYTSFLQRKQLPFKHLVTHGFVVDEKGQKMSKSLGNLISPSQLLKGPAGAQNNGKKKVEVPKTLLDKAWAVDVLRLWVASSDFTYDVSLGVKQLLKVQETYQKIRNTNRYLLSNLYDFDAKKDSVPYEKLALPDKWCLARLFETTAEIQKAYDRFAFTDVYRAITSFTVSDLSATYFDIVKDRLYTDAVCSTRRRATQTVLYTLLQSLPRLIAPITPFLAEEVHDYAEAKKSSESVFKAGYLQPSPEWQNASVVRTWDELSAVKAEVNRAIERLKKEGSIKSGMEVDLGLVCEKKDVFGCISEDDLADALLCSNVYRCKLNGDLLFEGQVTLPTESNLVYNIQIQNSKGQKCPRCWKYKQLETYQEGLPDVCKRCHDVLCG